MPEVIAQEVRRAAVVCSRVPVPEVGGRATVDGSHLSVLGGSIPIERPRGVTERQSYAITLVEVVGDD